MRLKPDDWVCRRARPDDWRDMLACWYGLDAESYEVGEYYRHLLTTPEHTSECFLAIQNGLIEAVAWLLPQSEKMFHCWPLRSRFNGASEQHRMCVKALWKHVYHHLISCGIKHCQTLISTQAIDDIETMSFLGFKKIALIKRMRVTSFTQQPGKCPLRLLKVDHENFSIFQSVFQATLIDSLDVPELNEKLPVEQSSRQYIDPHLHKFIIYDQHQTVVGVAVLECTKALGTLRYLGIMPHCRKHGFGRTAIHLLLKQLKMVSCDAVDVRVDARNIPALRLYEKTGFIHMDDEELMLAS